jgi:hypothetical protein
VVAHVKTIACDHSLRRQLASSWNWGYPYGSYYSGYGSGYGNYGYGYGSSGYDYRYGYPSGGYYGSYYSGTDYGNDDESAVRNVLAEYAVSWNSHDMAAFGRLFAENCDYVNNAGVHWKGVQENVQRHAVKHDGLLYTEPFPSLTQGANMTCPV